MKQLRLNPEDLNWCIKRLPRKVEKVLKDYSGSVSIGGGYIRSCITGDCLKDIDLFVRDKKIAEEINTRLLKTDQREFKTKNAYTILRGDKPPIQIITRWLYEKPTDILNDLDFSICCAVIWFGDGSFRSAIHPMYYNDLAAKRLRYTSPSRIEEAGGSLLRVLKYYNKGYRIMLTSFAKVIARTCIAVEQVNKVISEDRLGEILNGLLVEVDPNAVGEVDFIDDNEPEEGEDVVDFNEIREEI